jgi:hypothetical protein
MYGLLNVYGEYPFDVKGNSIYFIDQANLQFSRGNVDGSAAVPLQQPSLGTNYTNVLVNEQESFASIIPGNTNARIFDIVSGSVNNVSFFNSHPIAHAIKGDRFFFSSMVSGREIYSAGKLGDAVTVHVPAGKSYAPGDPNSVYATVTVNGDHIFYWSVSNKLIRHTISNGLEVELFSDSKPPTTVKVAESMVWVLFNSPARVFSVNLDGSGVKQYPEIEALASQPDPISGVAPGLGGVSSYGGIIYTSAFSQIGYSYCGIIRYNMSKSEAKCIGTFPASGAIFATEKWILTGNSHVVRTPRW